MPSKIICFVKTSNTLKYCHHVIMSSCHHVIMSSCHLPIPLFSVYHCIRTNIGKLSKTPFFTGKYRDFFLRKFDFLRVSGAFWGGDSVGLRWDFSVIMKIWCGGLCEFSMKILRLTMKSWGLQWLFGYLQWKSRGLRWDGSGQLLYAGSPMVFQRWRFYRRLELKSNLIYLSVPLWFSYFSFQKMINSTQLIHPSFKVLLKSSKLKTKSRNGSPNF